MRLPVTLVAVIRLDAATVLLQWSTGGMAFCWVTTRHRLAGLGYGWLLRGIYLVLATGAAVVGLRYGSIPVREAASLATAAACGLALAVSMHRRAAGVSGANAEHERRTARVAAMTGITREPSPQQLAAAEGATEFPPVLDLVPVAFGVIGLTAAALDAAPGGGADAAVALLRTLVGAAFLGCVTDAMLLGHWYLVQPGLPAGCSTSSSRCSAGSGRSRSPCCSSQPGCSACWSGAVDDGWNGTLGWFWGACAITTIVLVIVTREALKERQYAAVMAATGLLYLAILTAFGTDLVARAVLAG